MGVFMRWWCFWRLQEKKYWLAEEFFRKSVFFELFSWLKFFIQVKTKVKNKNGAHCP